VHVLPSSVGTDGRANDGRIGCDARARKARRLPTSG
jgi:hypothetical protein